MARTDRSQFGDQLRRLREAAALTQDELAERAGLSREAVSALERGHRRHPHPHTVRALSTALGLSEPDIETLRTLAARRAGAQPCSPADTPPPALPVPFTHLVGRRRELGELQDVLTSGARLVTLTGPGGVGKTRLALELATDVTPMFLDGVTFVSLAAVHDPALLLSTIAEALGMRDAGGLALAERLRYVLGDRRVLLVLDNFEQLAEATAPVAELLGACPGLTLLATSRAPLRLSGEREYPVPPLETPDLGQQTSLQSLAANEAVALFVQRAGSVLPDFELTEANAAAVAGICARLDGLPLAIELAAARVKVLPPEALLARLGTGLDVLAGGPRDQADRLRSMRAAIAWSYDLLDPNERQLFRRLSVFEGFRLAAAEDMTRLAGEDDAHDRSVFDGIASLMDKSLLRRLNADEGEPRFGMLSTIQEYGLERLAAAGESAAARHAHAAYFVELAEEAWPAFRQRTGHTAWLDRFEAERGNLRSALSWLEESGDASSLLQLSGALYWFWYIRGPISEGRSWLDRTLAVEAADAPRIHRLRALVGAGQLAHFQGDDRQAQIWLEMSLAESNELEDPWWLGLTIGILGAVAEDQGDYALAESRFAASLDLCRAANDGANAGAALLHLGIVAWGQGDVQRAAVRCEEAVDLQRAVGDAWGLSNSLAYLGLLAEERGEHTRAAALHRESLGLRWESRVWEDVAGSLFDIAALAAAVDRPEQAARLFGAAEALVEEQGRVLKLPERAVYGSANHRARTAMGEAAFATARGAGRALPRELAVAEASCLAEEIAHSGGDV